MTPLTTPPVVPRETIRALVGLAIRAPSGDNTQPWKFVFDESDGTLRLRVDETRLDTPECVWSFVARLSCGAALENLLLAAPALGLRATPLEPCAGEVARVALEPAARVTGDGEALDAILRRGTNRRIYDRRPLAAEVVASLGRAAPPEGGAEAIWVVDRGRVDGLADVVFRIDATMYGYRPMWKAIESRIRFDRPAAESVSLGLPRAALELPSWKVALIRRLRGVPHGLLRGLGLVRALSRRTRALVRSSSGLLVVVVRDDDARSDMFAGRLLERCWLALAREGLAAHPMNSVALVERLLDHGEHGGTGDGLPPRATREVREFRALVPEVGARRVVFVMRFGGGGTAACRTGRLEVEDVLCFVGRSAGQDRRGAEGARG